MPAVLAHRSQPKVEDGEIAAPLNDAYHGGAVFFTNYQ